MLIINPETSAVSISGASNKSNISNAEYVYLQNTKSKDSANGTIFIVVKTAADVTKSIFALGTNGSIILKKDKTDTVYSGTGINGGGGQSNEAGCAATKISNPAFTSDILYS